MVMVVLLAVAEVLVRRPRLVVAVVRLPPKMAVLLGFAEGSMEMLVARLARSKVVVCARAPMAKTGMRVWKRIVRLR